jgi:putative transposase
VCLRFVFLLAVQIPAWLRLSRRPSAWKDTEILLLRHQLAVLQRQTAARPRLTWTDRALFAALLTLIPRSRHGALHSFITPGTILRWHRDIVRRRWAAKSKLKRPGRPPARRPSSAWCCAWRPATSIGGTGGSLASWPGSASPSHPRRSERS